MGDWQTIKATLIQWISKYYIFIVYISIGISVQIAMYDNKQNLSFWQRVCQVIASIAAGAIASMLCNAWKWDKVAMFVVPTTTLLGQSLFEYIIKNWKAPLDAFVNRWIKNNTKQ